MRMYIVPISITFLTISGLFGMLFGYAYWEFQSIALESVSLMGNTFAQQSSSFSELLAANIQQLATQLYYSDEVTQLRTPVTLEDGQIQTYLSQLDQVVSENEFINSIYIYNHYDQMVYATASTTYAQSLNELSDTSAKVLFENRTSDSYLKAVRRTFTDPTSGLQTVCYSFLFFPYTADGDPVGSALMLNATAAQYATVFESLHQEGDFVLLDGSHSILLASNSGLKVTAQLFLPQLSTAQLLAESGYLIDTIDGESYVCFHYPMDYNNWQYLRILPLDACLPGLSSFRSNMYTGLLIGCLVVISLSVTALLTFYVPFKRIRKVLHRVEQTEYLPTQGMEQLIETSIGHHQSQVLRQLLIGEVPNQSLHANPPYVLALFNHGDFTTVRSGLLSLVPSAMVGQKSGCVAVLFPQVSDETTIEDVCRHMATELGCRCFYSVPFSTLAEVATQYETLTELRSLRFWWPTPLALSASVMPPRTEASHYAEKQASQLLTAIRNGEDPMPLWQGILQSIQQDGFHHQFIAFSRMDTMLREALGDSTSPAIVTEPSMAQLEDIQILTLQFSTLFERLSRMGKDQRLHRLHDLTIQVQHCIEERYQDTTFSACDIAQSLDMSNAYLGRLFREGTGHSISEYLSRTRIQKATHLLIHTQLSAEQVANAVGFANAKYFFVVFKQYQGQTPLQYRRSQGQAETPM